MKNRFSTFILLLALALSSASCAGWVESYRRDPVSALQRDLSYIQTAVGLARGAFDVFAGINPEAANQARPQFNNVIFRVEAGLRTAQDGLRLAANARDPNPDVNALLADARAAVADLNALLTGLPGNGVGRASSPEMREAILATEAASRAN